MYVYAYQAMSVSIVLRALDAVEEGGEDLSRGGEAAVGQQEHSHEVLVLKVRACQLLEQLLQRRGSNLEYENTANKSLLVYTILGTPEMT